ncbi:YozE family protein [Marispirochaeta sp.]|uniref:YozE family protein n=1 Tax=Marispirochaeta sp. TaxID=2038653 RepID=UPI0029C6F14C|nr:YozE family protein [Marispirochaeta sp.]
MTFYEFIKSQKNRPDPVGDLAADILADRAFPQSVSTLEKLRAYLAAAGACPEALDAAKRAFWEYEEVKP